MRRKRYKHWSQERWQAHWRREPVDIRDQLCALRRMASLHHFHMRPGELAWLKRVEQKAGVEYANQYHRFVTRNGPATAALRKAFTPLVRC